MSRLTYKTPFWDLGLGDLVFYSMLGATAFMHGARYFPALGLLAPWIPFVAVSLGVMAGLVLTIKLLERNYMMPGLPISTFLGLGILAAVHLAYLWFR